MCLKAFVTLVEQVCSSARCPRPQCSFGRCLQQAAGVKSRLQSLQIGEIWTTASVIPRNLCTTEVESRILAKRNVSGYNVVSEEGMYNLPFHWKMLIRKRL